MKPLVEQQAVVASRTVGAGGFTLLELIAVLGILSVLLGVGVGFLNRGSTDADAAITAIRGQLRLAATTAQSDGLPTEVVFEGGQDGAASQIYARVLRDVGYWPFEERFRYLPRLLQPSLNGTREPRGRFGAAWRAPVDAEGEPSGTMFEVATEGSDRFYLDEGFAFRADVRIEARLGAVLTRYGRCFEVRWDDDLVPSVVVTLGGDGMAGERIVVTDTRSLPMFDWATIEAVHDGRRLRLLVNDRLAGEREAVGEPFQENANLFLLSPRDAPMVGLVDDVILRAYGRSEPQFLPRDVVVRGLDEPLRFDRRGAPVTQPKIQVEFAEDARTFSVGLGGALQ